MYLNCCHRRLLVCVANDLRGDDGGMAFGLWQPATMRILLDRACPPDQRREVLVHELVHAWEDIAGKVDGDNAEAAANRNAAIDAQFARDLTEQGGESCIHRMYGDEDTIPPEDPMGGELATELDESNAEWPTRISCPACHQHHASGLVRNGTPAFDPKLNGFVRWRVMSCTNCEREFRWLQQCNWEGLPLPNVIVSPTLRHLAKVSE